MLTTLKCNLKGSNAILQRFEHLNDINSDIFDMVMYTN